MIKFIFGVFIQLRYKIKSIKSNAHYKIRKKFSSYNNDPFPHDHQWSVNHRLTTTGPYDLTNKIYFFNFSEI